MIFPFPLAIGAGADVNYRNEYGETALFLAVVHGHTSLTRSLLQRGADPNIPGPSRWTPLDAAEFRKDRKQVNLLLEYGARRDLAQGVTSDADPALLSPD